MPLLPHLAFVLVAPALVAPIPVLPHLRMLRTFPAADTVLVLGAMHRQATVEARRPGHAGVRGELVIAALVLLVTSLLTGTAPPGE